MQLAGLHYHALPSRQWASSTPVRSRTQPWTAAKGRTNNKPPQQPRVQLENRFAPLQQDPGSPSDDLDYLSSSYSRERTESKSESKRLQGKLTPGPQTLILGDCAIKDLRSMCSKNTKILCFPKDMVSDISERILHIMAAHPNVKNVILHIDFIDLLNTVSSLNAEVFISGPLPPVRKGVERFTACTVHSQHFFWDRRHLFKADAHFLNKYNISRILAKSNNIKMHFNILTNMKSWFPQS
uniref:Uncharacterized protein n=1 Tax=Seriola lalandi dorsalis TaxID=1841481 RepID=A0A3B4WW15_SERLL